MQPDNTNRPKFDAAGLSSAQDLAGQGGLSTAAKPKSEHDRVDWIFGTSDLSFGSFDIGRHTTSDHLPLSVIVRVR
jgi:endonuclease/exonuclease/phosphatase family metal-dependent hydrolase